MITRTGMITNDGKQIADIEWQFAHDLIDALRSVRNTLDDREMKTLAARVQGISKKIDDAMKYRRSEIATEAAAESVEQVKALEILARLPCDVEPVLVPAKVVRSKRSRGR